MEARRRLLPLLVALPAVAWLLYLGGRLLFDTPQPPPVRPGAPVRSMLGTGPPVRLAAGRWLTVWWDAVPHGLLPTLGASAASNVHPADYAGPDSCKGCHPGNHQTWSAHPHRWMNALASEETVRGDFSGNKGIAYRGGRATFTRRDGAFVMSLERDDRRRTYRVTQTIGSRFYQYYVGRLTEGPEPPEHHFRHKDHVLPFGYWLSRREWVPVVHVGPELPDDQRPDPFDPPESGRHYAEYAASCNYCHTTFALGDLFSRRPHQVGEHASQPLHWSARGYLAEARPTELAALVPPGAGTPSANPTAAWDAASHALTYGVSCEACHLGSREHVESRGMVPPRFAPGSPYLFVEKGRPRREALREDVNWACGRCHTGSRPALAAGMATWNSVEFSDAARGSCYSQLRCVDCHSPHQAIGPAWTRTPDQDDAVCLKCHDAYRAADRRRAHTHHAPGSTGDRCLNCHMPRLHEGLDGVVRTHMIYAPTRADMIEANHPNACNLCHVDKPIGWTLDHLKGWYGSEYNMARVLTNYPHREQPAALGWLASGNEAVRLVGADALLRARDRSALPRLLEALDDPYLLNRQFTARGLEEAFGLRLEDGGYRFYMTREERAGPLRAFRAR